MNIFSVEVEAGMPDARRGGNAKKERDSSPARNVDRPAYAKLRPLVARILLWGLL
jgi:hypothetical protein